MKNVSMRSAIAITIAGLWFASAQSAWAASEGSSALERGLSHCDHGAYTLALDTLRTAYEHAPAGDAHAQAAGGLGHVYLQMGQSGEAEPYLREAASAIQDSRTRARYMIEFANLLASRGQANEARKLYANAANLAAQDASITLSASLNAARLLAPAERLLSLQGIYPNVAALQSPSERSQFLINLGSQARKVGADGSHLAYQALNLALENARGTHDPRLQAEAYEELSQLYEDQQRWPDALQLTRLGIEQAQLLNAHDLLLKLEWRRARLLAREHQTALAIQAYERAVEHIEAVRQDIPVEYLDGKSSFRETLEPVYLGLADLLLQSSDQLSGKEQAAQLRHARDTVELIKQTEMEDFLGDRCAVGGTRHSLTEGAIPEHAALVYPIILPDRVELLVETSHGIVRKTSVIDTRQFQTDVQKLASALREHLSYLPLSKKLYTSLLRPLENNLEAEHIDTLVIVPDGVLRLLPFGALHDGKQFAIQKYAIAVIPGMSFTSVSDKNGTHQKLNSLLAGVSEPGEVVTHLPPDMTRQLLATAGVDDNASASGESRSLLTRSLKHGEVSKRDLKGGADSESTEPISEASILTRNSQLKHILALPGVQEEISNIGKLAPGRALLNSGFSVDAFGTQIASGDFNVVHIASHGVFGGTADTTFIIAYDNVITIDKLQDFLRTTGKQGVKGNPIELLTLSACETAEGDDRAPLGLSGAALKAQAHSALGSLWPIADAAAKTVMPSFYTNLVQNGQGKAKSLQQAQLELLKDKRFEHPFFWAPFILVGDWQ